MSVVRSPVTLKTVDDLHRLQMLVWPPDTAPMNTGYTNVHIYGYDTIQRNCRYRVSSVNSTNANFSFPREREESLLKMLMLGHITYSLYDGILARSCKIVFSLWNVNITPCSLETLQAIILNIANDILLYSIFKNRVGAESNMH